MQFKTCDICKQPKADLKPCIKPKSKSNTQQVFFICEECIDIYRPEYLPIDEELICDGDDMTLNT